MPTQTLEDLEERIAAVEMKMERLEKASLAQKSKEPRGWQRMVGIFADNPLFEDAVREGRKWREAEDPMDNEAVP